MIVTDDEGVFERASLLKFHGMDREAWKRFAKEGSPRYDVEVPGFKYNMMDKAALESGSFPARRLLRSALEAGRTLHQALSARRVDPYAARPYTGGIRALYTPRVDFDRLTISRQSWRLKRRKSATDSLHGGPRVRILREQYDWSRKSSTSHFVSDGCVAAALYGPSTPIRTLIAASETARPVAVEGRACLPRGVVSSRRIHHALSFGGLLLRFQQLRHRVVRQRASIAAGAWDTYAGPRATTNSNLWAQSLSGRKLGRQRAPPVLRSALLLAATSLRPS